MRVLPRSESPWDFTPQNLASEEYVRDCYSLKCQHIFGLYYTYTFQVDQNSDSM